MHDFIQCNKDECWSLGTYRLLYYVNNDIKSNSLYRYFRFTIKNTKIGII